MAERERRHRLGRSGATGGPSDGCQQSKAPSPLPLCRRAPRRPCAQLRPRNPHRPRWPLDAPVPNPKGIPPQSPGLRRRSYPGTGIKSKFFNPKGGCGPVCKHPPRKPLPGHGRILEIYYELLFSLRRFFHPSRMDGAPWTVAGGPRLAAIPPRGTTFCQPVGFGLRATLRVAR